MARGESEKRVESLSKLIEEAGALGLTGAREQGVQLRFNLDPQHDLVLVDRVQIQQVLVNLFRNALEAMAHSSRRELTVSNTPAADDMIEIAVSDTGSGFGEDVAQNLFQTFFTTKETGMGVGLSISRSIIEAHGGRMWAETNRGRRRDVSLHVARRIKREFDRWQLGERSMSSTTTRRCGIRSNFLLDAADFDVTLFESAQHFLDGLPTSTLAAWSPTSACPASTASNFCKRLKASHSSFPVLIMTGHGDVPLAVEAMKLGAVDFLEKPFEDDRLIGMIDSALKQAESGARSEAATLDIAARVASLSPRERQVMEGLVAGLSNKHDRPGI